MKKYKSLLEQISIKPISYLKKGNSLIISTKDKKYVIKEKINNSLIYSYLEGRAFKCFKNPIIDNETYEVTEYLDEIPIPQEQKLEELMKVVALLHNKTTYYEKTSIAYNKEIYERLKNNIEYLKSYYIDIIALIERKEFMSPSEYLFARNFTVIMSSLNYDSEKVDEWYKKIKDKESTRFVVIHNNLDLEHFIYNQNKALLSWRKAKFGSPIFDLIAIYEKYGNKYDFKSTLEIYENVCPLEKEEKELLHIFMLLPPKIEFKGNELDLCNYMTKKIELLYNANKIILPNKFKNGEENNQNKN